jgi:hypothetical protein
MRRDDPVLRQLSLSYRDGPLADGTGTDRLRSGDRAPDAPCGPVRIFDLLRGPHWTLLVFDAPGADLPPATPDLHIHHISRAEAGGDAHDAYGVTRASPRPRVRCRRPASMP